METSRNIFEITHALSEILSRDITRTRPSGTDRIANTNDDGLWRSRFNVVVMSLNRMTDTLAQASFAGQLSTDMVMLAFNFVGNCLAHIVQQRRYFGSTNISANLASNHTSHMRHFGRMLKNILAVASSKL